MALLHEEEDNHNREDKRSNKAQRAATLQNLKKAHLTGAFHCGKVW